MTNQDHNPTLPSYLRPDLLDETLASIALWDAETTVLLPDLTMASANDELDNYAREAA